jgi:Ca2+-binding EF-hand superfamily protein
MVGHQGLNMRAKLNDFDQQKNGKLNLTQFKKAVKSLSFAMNDTEIEGLFKASETAHEQDFINPSQTKLDVRKFCVLI